MSCFCSEALSAAAAAASCFSFSWLLLLLLFSFRPRFARRVVENAFSRCQPRHAALFCGEVIIEEFPRENARSRARVCGARNIAGSARNGSLVSVLARRHRHGEEFQACAPIRYFSAIIAGGGAAVALPTIDGRPLMLHSAVVFRNAAASARERTR